MHLESNCIACTCFTHVSRCVLYSDTAVPYIHTKTDKNINEKVCYNSPLGPSHSNAAGYGSNAPPNNLARCGQERGSSLAVSPHFYLSQSCNANGD